MKKVVVTREVFDETIEYLSQRFDVTSNQDDRKLSDRELALMLTDAIGVQTASSDRVDQRFLDLCPRAKIIANTAVGYNNIDIPECTKRGVMVTNTPGVLDDSVADFAVGLMIAASRRMGEGERFVREGRWESVYLKQMLGKDVCGSTLGLLGFGRIGKVIAQRVAGFNMKVLYHTRNKAPESVEAELKATYVSKEVLLRTSDFVVLILPYSKETHHYIGETELAMMKGSSILVNVARGGIVDDDALIKALRDGKIFAAGLDVFEGEPKIKDEFSALNNVVLTPHIGSASETTRKAMAMTAAMNLSVALHEGNSPPNILNPEVLSA